MRYWIGLGANMGDRLRTLRNAVDALAKEDVTVLCRSHVFAASPVGGPPQPTFFNAAVLIESALEPAELLTTLQRIEARFGREREAEVRWGPRTLDLDILLVGARGEGLVDLPQLTIPHPRLHERAFALAPLCELDETLVHPTLARTLKTLLAAAHEHGQLAASTRDIL